LDLIKKIKLNFEKGDKLQHNFETGRRRRRRFVVLRPGAPLSHLVKMCFQEKKTVKEVFWLILEL
jgi:hypothetical protein